MTELRQMTDQELANRMVGYITRVQKLMDDISMMLQKQRKDSSKVNLIRYEYKNLKNEIKGDAHYLGLDKNERYDTNAGLYNGFFDPSIREAAAFGFMAPANSKVNGELYSACEEARYKLTKYYSFNKWKSIAEEKPA